MRAAQGSEPQVSDSMKAEATAGDADLVITVFTTRPDTLYGATYMVLSPEHKLVHEITTSEQGAAVEQYKQFAATRSDLERTELAKEKTGVFTGGYAVNPATGQPIPVWVAAGSLLAGAERPSALQAAGIDYVTDLKESGKLGSAPVVINMSLGGSQLDAVEKAAIDYAIGEGVIIVAAAGNEGEAGMGYPGAYEPVISAAAIGTQALPKVMKIVGPGGPMITATQFYAQLQGVDVALFFGAVLFTVYVMKQSVTLYRKF